MEGITGVFIETNSMLKQAIERLVESNENVLDAS
jgi:hypothetical protein